MAIIPSLGRQVPGTPTAEFQASWNKNFVIKEKLKTSFVPGLVVHNFNPGIREAEVGRFLNSRPIWSMEGVLGQPGLKTKTTTNKTKGNCIPSTQGTEAGGLPQIPGFLVLQGKALPGKPINKLIHHFSP